MWTLPCSAPQKISVILYGAAVGLLMIPLACLCGLVLGVLAGTIQTLLRVHGEGAWTMIAGVELGFYLGIPLGIYVCWRICRSRLREPKS